MKTIAQALETYLQRRDMHSQMGIARLWQHWPEVVGSHLAEMAKPLGRRKKSLLIGVSDSTSMQELRFYSQDILDNVQAFLGWQPFDKVIVELIKGRTCLDAVFVTHTWWVPKPERPETVGGLRNRFPQGTAIRSCYEAYLKAFENE